MLLNGRPDPALDFTRARDASSFGTGPVKFKREIPIALTRDAQRVVIAVGEHSTLNLVMAWNRNPAAASNPIYVDADGFQYSKDTLGSPLPVKAQALVRKSAGE